MKTAPPPVRGVSGLALVFCSAAAIAGLGIDFVLGDGARFGVIGEPGGRAVLGVGVAAAVVLVARALRLLLGRRVSGDPDASEDS